jgi:hypothetical protein
MTVTSGTRFVGNRQNTHAGNVSFNFNADEFSSKLLLRIEKIMNEQAKAIVNFKLKKRLSSGGYGIIAKDTLLINSDGSTTTRNFSNGSIKKWDYDLKKTDNTIQVGFFNNAKNKTNDFQYVGTIYGKKGVDSDGVFKPHRWHPDGFASKEQGMNESKVMKIKEEIKEKFKKEIQRGIRGKRL